MNDDRPTSPPLRTVAHVEAFEPAPMRPGRNGGRLMSGNPKSRGRTPSWIREQLRRGLVQALPAIKHALKTGKDLRTGAWLSWSDFTRVVEVASRISMPAQSELGASDGPPIVVELTVSPEAAAEAARERSAVPYEIDVRPVAKLPRVASAEPAASPIDRAPPPPRRSPFGPGVQ